MTGVWSTPIPNVGGRVKDLFEGEGELAPGRLRLVHEFLNAMDAEPSPERLAMAEAIRARSAQGESQAALARAYGISQPLVSAILGGRRLGPRNPGLTGCLGSPAEARVWLAARGLAEAAGELSDVDVARLRELKRVLRGMAGANNGIPTDRAMLERLDLLAADALLFARFTNGAGPELQPAARGVSSVTGAILGAVTEAMYAGTWERLKACPGSDCLWVFYDRSPKGSRTWCWMSICGNRAKVRNYQERRRTAKGSGAVG